VIEDAAGGTGSEMLTHTLAAGESLAVWAAGYDVTDNYVGDRTVTWSGTGAVAGRLTQTNGVSTTFAAEMAGIGIIEADAGGGITDTTGLITVVPGALNYIVIEDAAGGTGSETLTRTLAAGESLVAWAAGYDAEDNYIGDQMVTWSGAGVVAERLAPTSGISTTFSAGEVGAGVIEADAGGGITDTTELVTVVPGALNYIVIEDMAGGTGNQVFTRTLALDGSLTVWAAGYDVADNYIGDQAVTWSGTGVAAGRLAPTSGISTTFTAEMAGTGVIEADDGGGITDATGTIVVSTDLWITYIPMVMRNG
ncbi:MAG: hypothetical protein GY832_46430, partial [Chloroflexi bacterium]|nr:hypothetical protein [Chloroflexota bacterium]